MNDVQLKNELDALQNSTKPASTEPAMTVGVATTGIASGIFLILKYLIPNVNDEALNAIALIVALLLPVIVGWITRGKVWAPASVSRAVSLKVREIQNKGLSRNRPPNDPPTIIG